MNNQPLPAIERIDSVIRERLVKYGIEVCVLTHRAKNGETVRIDRYDHISHEVNELFVHEFIQNGTTDISRFSKWVVELLESGFREASFIEMAAIHNQPVALIKMLVLTNRCFIKEMVQP